MQEAKYTVTLKGESVSDPWLIIKTDTLWELSETLDKIIEGDIATKIKWAQRQVRYEVSGE